ncbi:MAG: hypothetical protein ACLQT6_13390 [Desulfomonilaceae bacterium]
MSEQKMGTQHAREICRIFREIAAKTGFPEVKEKLLFLASDLEPIATKIYFKTQKGTEDMERLSMEAALLEEKLTACELGEDAKVVCDPFLDQLQKVMHHAKTLKVRMT